MIWCVDDDKTILEIELYTLQQTGFSAKGFSDGISMLEALETEIPNLIILDIMLPKMDGIEILKELRKSPKTEKLPVIMATAKGEEMDRINGLDTGADDYLVKPFGMMEMVSRIKAVLRRCEPTEKASLLTIDGIALDEKKHIVTVNGEITTLTLKEYDLLKLFLKNKGQAFSRDKLLSEIWGVDFLGESRTVDMHIKNLRQKLGEQGKHIQTVIGVGYRMGVD